MVNRVRGERKDVHASKISVELVLRVSNTDHGPRNTDHGPRNMENIETRLLDGFGSVSLRLYTLFLPLFVVSAFFLVLLTRRYSQGENRTRNSIVSVSAFVTVTLLVLYILIVDHAKDPPSQTIEPPPPPPPPPANWTCFELFNVPFGTDKGSLLPAESAVKTIGEFTVSGNFRVPSSFDTPVTLFRVGDGTLVPEVKIDIIGIRSNPSLENPDSFSILVTSTNPANSHHLSTSIDLPFGENIGFVWEYRDTILNRLTFSGSGSYDGTFMQTSYFMPQGGIQIENSNSLNDRFISGTNVVSGSGPYINWIQFCAPDFFL
jgi:hypothetical protein